MILCDREADLAMDQARIVIRPRPDPSFMDSTAIDLRLEFAGSSHESGWQEVRGGQVSPGSQNRVWAREPLTSWSFKELLHLQSRTRFCEPGLTCPPPRPSA